MVDNESIRIVIVDPRTKSNVDFVFVSVLHCLHTDTTLWHNRPKYKSGWNVMGDIRDRLNEFDAMSCLNCHVLNQH